MHSPFEVWFGPPIVLFSHGTSDVYDIDGSFLVRHYDRWWSLLLQQTWRNFMSRTRLTLACNQADATLNARSRDVPLGFNPQSNFPAACSYDIRVYRSTTALCSFLFLSTYLVPTHASLYSSTVPLRLLSLAHLTGQRFEVDWCLRGQLWALIQSILPQKHGLRSCIQ